ncbi:MAG: hypothetical protein ACXWMX_04100 [Candidatus Limnocylindrales bacterium]
MNTGHAAMHEAIAGLLSRTSGWVAAPEVSFSIYGERGVIDVLAWHGGRRVLLVIELKTHLADPQALVAQVDRYRRLAVKVARERGWVADTVSCWVVVAEGSTSRRRLAAHTGLLRTAFPADGRAIAGWLADPTRPLAALSFLSIGHGRNVSAVSRRIVRVRRPATPQG